MDDPIGTMIRREREAAGISQLEAGAQFGATALTVGKWERGQTVPELRYRGRLARWLGCSVREITDACIAGAEERRQNNTRRTT